MTPGKMIAFRHILVPLDFGASSRRALDVAIDLATKFDAKLTLFHAWEPPSYMYSTAYVPADAWTWLEEAARKELAEVTEATRKRVPAVSSASTLVCGSPGQAVLEAIDRMKVDLVVMGTHGRHGLGRMFLGSVAERVVRGSRVPVLTVRGEES